MYKKDREFEPESGPFMGANPQRMRKQINVNKQRQRKPARTRGLIDIDGIEFEYKGTRGMG
jgi:hypothetical protein